jgi:tetratricopeptide (TPR) repeat protein
MFERSLDCAKSAGLIESEGRCLSNLGSLAYAQGDLRSARDYFEMGSTLAARLDNKEMGVSFRKSSVNYYIDRGEFDLAREYAEEALSRARELAMPSMTVGLSSMLGRVLIAQGLICEAKASFEQAVALAEPLQMLVLKADVAGAIAKLHAIMGEFEAAEERLEKSMVLCGRADRPAARARAIRRAAEVCAMKEDFSAAEKLCRDALALLGETGPVRGRSLILTALGVSLEGLGQVDAGGEALVRAAALDQRCDIPSPASLLLATSPRSDVTRAERQLRAAQGRIQKHLELRLWYRLWRLSGRRTHLEVAHRILMFLQEHAPPESRLNMIQSIPTHRCVSAAWESSDTQ